VGAREEAHEMAEDSWNDHIRYLEDEVKKLGERADKLETMVPDLESAQKKHAARQLISHLRDEVREHSKYLALVKQIIQPEK
jgi:hypothetical protein